MPQVSLLLGHFAYTPTYVKVSAGIMVGCNIIGFAYFAYFA